MKSFDCKQCKVAADRSIFLTNLVKKLGFGGKKETEEATVISKRIASARFPTQGSTWDHWIQFSLADGTVTELLVPEDVYQAFDEGQSGMLTWSGDTVLTFEKKE